MKNMATTETAATDEPSGGAFSAAIYEPFLWLGEQFGMARRRRRLLVEARGRVLEVGAGTGLNLRHYTEAVDSLVMTEPIPEMVARIDLDDRQAAFPATTVVARAEELPFDDDSFDTVVTTMVLCTVQDPERAIAEIRRVLAPGGRLLFCEHVRAESRLLARLQDRLAGPWAAFAEGCRCDRETLGAIRRELRIESVERGKWRGMPALVHPLVVGAAVA